MKKLITAAAIVGGALTLGLQTAHAEDTPSGPYSGPYVGGGWGRFNLNVRNLEDVGTGINSIAHSEDDAWQLFAGYRFNPYVGVEAAYIDFGKPTDHFQATGSNGNYSVHLSGFAPSVVGIVPLGPVELFGRFGYYFYNNDLRVNLDSPAPGQSPGIDSSHSRSDLLYGGGLGVTLFDHLNARIEYEVVDLKNAHSSNALWLTAAWRF